MTPDDTAPQTWVNVTAVDTVLDRLVASGAIGPQDATVARDTVRVAAVPAAATGPAGGAAGSNRRPSWTGFGELTAYVGGSLTAGAVALEWPGRSGDDRAEMLTAVLLVLVLSGGLAGGGSWRGLRSLRSTGARSRWRLASVLFTVASGVAAGLCAVLVGVRSEPAAYLVPGVGLAVAVAGYAVVPALTGQLACWLWTLWLVVVPLPGGPVQPAASWAVLGAGAGWLLLARLALLRERYTGLGLGSVTILGGAQVMVVAADGWWTYLGTVAVGVSCFAIFAGTRNWLVLASGVAALTIATAEVLDALAGAAMSVGGGLLLAGLTLLGASVAGYFVSTSVRPPEGPTAGLPR